MHYNQRIMRTPPHNAEEIIGPDQKICRFINLDGKQIIVRLQKPFDEPPDDEDELQFWEPYGTVVVVETWSKATGTVVGIPIFKPEDQSDEFYSYAVRSMLNFASDDQILLFLRAKKIDRTLKFIANNKETQLKLPKPPKLNKDKKET